MSILRAYNTSLLSFLPRTDHHSSYHLPWIISCFFLVHYSLVWWWWVKYQLPGKYHHRILFNDPVIMVMLFCGFFLLSTEVHYQRKWLRRQNAQYQYRSSQVYEYFLLLLINYLCWLFNVIVWNTCT